MTQLTDRLTHELQEVERAGLMKRERPLTSPQGAHITTARGDFVNLCANNYLGLADHPALAAAARTAIDAHGSGMASVRFICGTHALHRELEARLASFLGTQDAILYAACFDANGGLFEPLLGPDDAIVSDALNHASIIDGVRLCKAKRYRYATGDLSALEDALSEARRAGARDIMIATDGVFSMDGTLAPLQGIADLAEAFGATVMVDDCHATGFIGPQGRGTSARFGVSDKVAILTGTLGKALGGTMGGYTAGPAPVIEMLRQKSRPYLFSNALPPSICAAALAALDLIEDGDDLRDQLAENTRFWRQGLADLGFEVPHSDHPIVPVMIGDAVKAAEMAAALFEDGIYVTAFSFPVVPKGAARIRTQMNAKLTRDDLERALAAFETAARRTGVLA